MRLPRNISCSAAESKNIILLIFARHPQIVSHVHTGQKVITDMYAIENGPCCQPYIKQMIDTRQKGILNQLFHKYTITDLLEKINLHWKQRT